ESSRPMCTFSASAISAATGILLTSLGVGAVSLLQALLPIPLGPPGALRAARHHDERGYHPAPEDPVRDDPPPRPRDKGEGGESPRGGGGEADRRLALGRQGLPPADQRPVLLVHGPRIGQGRLYPARLATDRRMNGRSSPPAGPARRARARSRRPLLGRRRRGAERGVARPRRPPARCRGGGARPVHDRPPCL